ncbi:glutaredoxin family protein [Halobacillus sp. Nhm2S1]|uniref:glutaredoxin family protein n=1 Tax=Halobacillus sp. Nhm2S1 TaxID=2866716 RepID=UPI001C731192|nr:glutaredoxin family protein [Halobacillus sp. Nhm2S1]MBX0357470.1 glutaredoxin family protein [Halobacillus sp. Nhm2S1]
MSEVILYVKEDCGLCDEVKDLLSLFEVQVVLVDIESDPALLEKYMLEIPVLKIDEEELDYREIDYFELMKRLQ